jgi:hypothetical protein
VTPHRHGRPPVDEAVTKLIERMATENHNWGYKWIQGELLKLGHRVGASTIRQVLKRAGIPPAPDRRTDTAWRQFLRTQASTMLACDFWSVNRPSHAIAHAVLGVMVTWKPSRCSSLTARRALRSSLSRRSK